MSNAIIWIFIYIPLIIFASLLFLYFLFYLFSYKIIPLLSRLYYEISWAILKSNDRFKKLIAFGVLCIFIIIIGFLLIEFLLLKNLKKKMANIPILKDYFKFFSIFIYLILFSIFITITLSPKKDLFMKIFTIIKDFFIVFFIIFIILFLFKLNNNLTINIDIGKNTEEE
jgi:hypothetical protein